MSFAARYDGRCVSCLERIYVGDQVAYDDDNLVHADCEASAPREASTPESCRRCFLVHPPGACEYEEDR